MSSTETFHSTERHDPQQALAVPQPISILPFIRARKEGSATSILPGMFWPVWIPASAALAWTEIGLYRVV